MDEKITATPFEELASVSKHPLKLHLGCGTKKLDGWINIDSVKECRPDVLYDLTQPLPCKDSSVDEILAEDLLEHFDKYMRYIVFGEWARILKMGGRITLQVPNFEKIIFNFFKLGFNNFVDFIFGETMLRSSIYIGHFGNHKWGYSEKSLKNFVNQFGIETIYLEKKGLNLRLVGEKKRHVPQEQLDKIQIYSHANATGIGEAYLSLGQVREKIKTLQNNTKNGG